MFSVGKKPQRLLHLAAFFYFLYALLVLYSHYLSGSFGYHDLGLINDFFGSTASGKGFFWVAEQQRSHFKTHFTPSLALLVPFYYVFDSSFLLLALGAFFLALGGWLGALLYEPVSKLCAFSCVPEKKEKIQLWVPSGLFLFFVLTRFPKNVLMGASCWFLFLPFALLVFHSIVRGWGVGWTFFWSLLALGVRQDCGIYLGSQMLLIASLPYAHSARKIRKQCFFVAFLSIAYTLFFALYLGPKLGIESHVERGWANYGSSWGQIILTLFFSPLKLLHDLWKSAFINLNLSFFLFTLWHLPAFIFANAPAVLLYICNDPAKKYLWYYNANFVLAGIYLAMIVGLLKALEWGKKQSSWKAKAPETLFLLALPVIILTVKDNNGAKCIPRFQSSQTLQIRRAIEIVRKECPHVTSIATDFKSLAFVPNSISKYFLSSFNQAQLVLLSSEVKRGFPGQNLDFIEQRQKILSEGFSEKDLGNGIFRFVKSPTICDSMQH